MRAIPLRVAIAMLLLAILSLTDFLPLALALLVVGKPTTAVFLPVVVGVLGLVGAWGLWVLKRWAMWLVIIVCVLNILINLYFLIKATEIASLATVINSVTFIVLSALVILLVVLPNSRFHRGTQRRMRRSTRKMLSYSVLHSVVLLFAVVFLFSQGAPYWIVYAAVILLTAELLLSLVLRHSIRYRFADKGLWIFWIFWIPIFRISYSRIREIEVAFDKEWYRTPGDLFPLEFFNKWYGCREGEGVRIRRKRGRPVLLSPDDPEAFVRELRRHVYEKRGEWPLVS